MMEMAVWSEDHRAADLKGVSACLRLQLAAEAEDMQDAAVFNGLL